MRSIILAAVLIVGLFDAAHAATYAHLETGQAFDPQQNDSASLYLKRYSSSITKGWHVERVPDLVQHNARYSGSMTPGSPEFMDGSKYINPDWTDGNGDPVPRPPEDE